MPFFRQFLQAQLGAPPEITLDAAELNRRIVAAMAVGGNTVTISEPLELSSEQTVALPSGVTLRYNPILLEPFFKVENNTFSPEVQLNRWDLLTSSEGI